MKTDNETTFLITPIHENGYMVPQIAVTVTSSDNAYSVAKKIAEKSSRLSQFPNWKFY